MELQEFKKVDPKSYDYYKLCYQVYRFLKSSELYQVIEKFDKKTYTKRLETSLKKCITDSDLDLAIMPDTFSGACWSNSFRADIFFWFSVKYDHKIRFTLLCNDKKLNAGNTIFTENAQQNINAYKKSLRRNLLKFIKTVKNYEEIKKEIEQKQKEFKAWHNLVKDQYSYYVLYEMGFKSLI